MLVLGISCYYHDSAVALVDERDIKFAIQEERLSRHKQDSRFPSLALGSALGACGLRINDIDRIVYYEDPGVKLRRIWDQVIDSWPRSRAIYDRELPRFVRDKMPIEQQLRTHFLYAGKVEHSEHHRSHAASAFFTSPFERALVVTIDGVGEYETASVHLGEGNRLTKLRSIHFPHSLGLFYSVFTQYLGFEVNEGEYKVMGLAPYGRPRYVDKLVGPVLRLRDDGSFSLNQRFFDFCSPARHYASSLPAHLGVPPRPPEGPMTEEHHDLAASVQQALEMAMLRMLPPLMRDYDCSDFCFAGGVALNCTANARMIRDLGIRSHIHPAAGDAGGALGAALQSVMRSAEGGPARRYRLGAYLGNSYPKAVIRASLARNDVPYRESGDIAEDVAEALAAGKVVGILHGRDEWGPRALGARSILADPRHAEMKDHLNAKIKFREEFRPFAPVVKAEAYGDWFETLGMAESPFMLYTHKALRPEQTAAITHVDGTARVQTVSAEQNPYVYRIIEAFERRTGVPVLINTSFNLRGEPMVSSPTDALKTFYNSGIDCLALEDFLVEKSETAPQPRAADLHDVQLVGDGQLFKAMYFDRERLRLRPNLTVVDADGATIFETNEAGLKGDPLDPSRKLVVAWGDSVAFGARRGWACLLDRLAPGYQFLNGGLGGDPYANILRRAAEFNRQHEVALNLLMLGWHVFIPEDVLSPEAGAPAGGWNGSLRRDLDRFLAEHPNTVVLTMPTALNPRILDRDLSGDLTAGDDATGFDFLGEAPCRVAWQRQAFGHIVERNAIARKACAARGIRVVDLFAHFDTSQAADYREHFRDILHLRACAYPKLAQIVYDGIKDLLE